MSCFTNPRPQSPTSMNRFLTFFLTLTISLVSFCQERKYQVIPINLPKGITTVSCRSMFSDISTGRDLGTCRFFLCKEVNRSMYYVFDSRDITVEEIHTRPGSQYLGFMGDTLIGYCERNDSIFLIDYPTKQTIQSVIYPNDYLKILKYVGRLGLLGAVFGFAVGIDSRSFLRRCLDCGNALGWRQALALLLYGYGRQLVGRIDKFWHWMAGQVGMAGTLVPCQARDA